MFFFYFQCFNTDMVVSEVLRSIADTVVSDMVDPKGGTFIEPCQLFVLITIKHIFMFKRVQA